MPTNTLELARDSLRRLRQIDDELEVMRSRIGGQGTGLSPKIDHTIILDVMRNVDDYIESEHELPKEGNLCKSDIDKGWVVIFGLEELAGEEEMNEGMKQAIMQTLALRYLYDARWCDIPKTACQGRLSSKDVCDVTLRWLEGRGLAHVKEAAARGTGGKG